MKQIFLILIGIITIDIAYADDLPKIVDTQQVVQPNQPIQTAPSTVPQINTSNNSNPQTKPILILTEDDRKSLSELNKFFDDLEPKIKNQIQEFEKKMKILRAQSQDAYEKLSHEAKLALKGKKDKIDILSDAAKKTYFKNE